MRRFVWILAVLIATSAAVPGAAAPSTATYSFARQEVSIDRPLVGEQTERLTPAGTKADLYVRADQMSALLTDLQADPARYYGKSVLIETSPWTNELQRHTDEEVATANAIRATLTSAEPSPQSCGATSNPAIDKVTGIYLICAATGDPVWVPRRFKGSGTEARVTELLAYLAQGPTGVELASGLSSSFTGSRSGIARSVQVNDGEVRVDLSAEFGDTGQMSSAAVSAFYGQLTSSILAVPGVESAVFTIGGSCEAFWEALEGPGCYRITRSGEIEPLQGTILASPQAAATAAYTDFWPASHNGRKIFLSVACHNANNTNNTACRPNYGCYSGQNSAYNENLGSQFLAYEAVLGTGGGTVGNRNLIERGYAVRIGESTRENNITNSNAWTDLGSKALHIPLHTNAPNASTPGLVLEPITGTRVPPAGYCGAPSASGAGFQPQIRFTGSGSSAVMNANQVQAADQMILAMIAAGTPGTADEKRKQNLAEKSTTGLEAVALYMEVEYHTWNSGVNFLRNRITWAYRIGNGVDLCFGYPRWTTTPYPHVQITQTRNCTWAASS